MFFSTLYPLKDNDEVISSICESPSRKLIYLYKAFILLTKFYIFILLN